MRTAQGAVWATSLGTLPRTLPAPRMRLLPTTIRSAPTSSATDTMPAAARAEAERLGMHLITQDLDRLGLG